MKYIKVGEISQAVKILNSPSSKPFHNNTLNKLSQKYPPRFKNDDELPDELWNQVLNYNINTDSNTISITCTVEDLEKILISKGRLIC